MDIMLSSENFPAASVTQKQELETKLQTILQNDFKGSLFTMLADYQRVLADNQRRAYWPQLHDNLKTLFMCGRAIPLDGPMIGIPVAIRDSDFFRKTSALLGKNRSLLASIEVLATAWNTTLADTGLWMGKSFEPVTEELVRDKCVDDAELMAAYDPATSRIGRNFFREPLESSSFRSLVLDVLEQGWNLQERPLSVNAGGFLGELLQENLDKEKFIPYTKTGGIYLANMGHSVVPEMLNKKVYQLNYRWPRLNPVFPMTLLVDEMVQIGEGIYLGQLVYATKHYSLGAIDLPFIPGERDLELGEPYQPGRHSILGAVQAAFSGLKPQPVDYGYQNNGYFLLMDPAYAKQIYADDAFSQLRPRAHESGFKELGYDTEPAMITTKQQPSDWISDWREDEALRRKFTTLYTEPSTRPEDGDVREMLGKDESVLQMLQRISNDISAQSKYDDHLKHFEALHRLFRSGVAPGVQNGLFQASGVKGYNTRINGTEAHDWYGQEELTEGFDYYHGATLNLHWGFSETFCPDRDTQFADTILIPSVLANNLATDTVRGANFMNMVWHSIGKYIFPWAGKSFEKITPRKLSMLLDESPDLAQRYPQRVSELRHYLASAPHYALVKYNQRDYHGQPGRYAEHLSGGSWDQYMSDTDREFWSREANEHWVMGYNLQDKRVIAADALMRIADMNYRVPELCLQQASEQSGSPFVRQGYCFLGLADQTSILPMNNGDAGSKRVFQFHYRYPLIGGPVPIGFCLDEIVEIADGLFLGQLIYSTALAVPFHSSVAASEYKYQLFGYFLLLDDDWERHRQAIKLDTLE